MPVVEQDPVEQHELHHPQRAVSRDVVRPLTATVCQPGSRSMVLAAEAADREGREHQACEERARQKGVTWRRTDRWERSHQTHRRFSSKDGTVPTAVATTLATTASTPRRPTSIPRMVRLVAVATPDTAE